MVEEIDFIKRNLVSLAHLTQGRTLCNSFLVNDSIFVFGGVSAKSNAIEEPFAKYTATEQDLIRGEKYTMSENKWKEVDFKGNNG